MADAVSGLLRRIDNHAVILTGNQYTEKSGEAQNEPHQNAAEEMDVRGRIELAPLARKTSNTNMQERVTASVLKPCAPTAPFLKVDEVRGRIELAPSTQACAAKIPALPPSQEEARSKHWWAFWRQP
jgi:hypothetical protein